MSVKTLSSCAGCQAFLIWGGMNKKMDIAAILSVKANIVYVINCIYLYWFYE